MNPVLQVMKALAEHELWFDSVRPTGAQTYYCSCLEVRSEMRQRVLLHQAEKIMDALGWVPQPESDARVL